MGSAAGQAGKLRGLSMPTAALNENDRLDSSIWKITTVAVFGSFLSQLKPALPGI